MMDTRYGVRGHFSFSRERFGVLMRVPLELARLSRI
jgi:hypothetical protein